MNPRKVIFINRFFYPDHSATSQILTDIAFDLAATGRRVEVITSRLRYDDPATRLPPFETFKGVRIHRVWTSRFGRATLAGRTCDYLTFYLTAAFALLRHAGRDTVVVVKTDPPLIAVVVAPVAKLRGASHINWLQDLFPEVAAALGVRVARGAFLDLLRWLRNRTLRSARTNVVLCGRMETLVRAQGVAQGQVRVIHNWADGDAIFPIAPEDNSLREDWGLRDRFVVGYSGNLGRAHEFDTILDAAQALACRPEIVFLFIGGGAQRAMVESEVHRRGLDNVQFRPYQPRERLGESLGVANVHLISLNPKLEGMIVPSKFYGIAAAGRATLFVGDTDGEIARILAAEACGRTVASSDAAALVAFIAELADDRALCERLGRNARRAFDLKFERKQALLAWQRVIEEAGP